MATISGMSCVSTSGTVSPGDFGLGTALIKSGCSKLPPRISDSFVLFPFSVDRPRDVELRNPWFLRPCYPSFQSYRTRSGRESGSRLLRHPRSGNRHDLTCRTQRFLGANAGRSRCWPMSPEIARGRKGNGGPIGADPLSTPSPPDRLPACAVDAGVLIHPVHLMIRIVSSLRA
jgi:hypothetical protein